MVRTLPHPSAFAGVDAKRIAGNTLVVSLHVLAFAVLMMPAQWQPPETRRETVVVPEIVQPPIKLKPVLPPPDKPRVVTERPRDRTPRPVVEQPPVEQPPVFAEGTELAQPVIDVGPPVDTFEPGPPAQADLALDVHPTPRYPSSSIRRGEEGLVLLRVLVDAQGRPQEVSIERSSGHTALDRSARDTVLQRWRFRPAQRDGHDVAAWGLVPVRFTLP